MTPTLHSVPMLLAQASGQGNPLGTLLLPLMLVAVYFLMMRPQQKRLRQQRELMAALKQGDRIVAAGGIVGTIRRVDDDTLSLQVADNVVIKVDRSSVSRKVSD